MKAVPEWPTGELEMVRHHAASAVCRSSAIVREIPDMLIKQIVRAEDYWSNPAAAIRRAPVDCARRELREETGCTDSG